MKKVLLIVLGLLIIVLAYVVYDQLATPQVFMREKGIREAAVIKRIIDIRSAEQAFKAKYQRYTGDFDSLVNFVLTDSLPVERTLGSKDDSLAVAKGLVKSETFFVAVMDTIFSNKLSAQDIREFPIIPYSKGEKYILNAGTFTTESGVIVPVFECKAPYKSFLGDLNQQELANLIDDQKLIDKYPGIKVGAMDRATNDAGNWE